MKKLLPLLFFIAFTGYAFAQNAFFEEDTVLFITTENPIDFEYIAKTKMKNETGAMFSYDWSVEKVNGPNEWEFLFCDNIKCYSTGVSMSPETVVLDVLESGTMDLHIRPNSTAGEGEYRVYAYTSTDTFDVGTYKLCIGEQTACSFTVTSSTKDVKANYDLSISPNPTNNGFILNSDYKGITSVNIYNVLGKLVHSEEIREGQFCDLAHLRQGLYIVQPMNQSGQALKSMRLIKN